MSFNKKLIIRAAFLGQCRQVVGLNLPDVPCRREGCGRVHFVFTDEGLPEMRLNFYHSPIKSPNNFDSEYDPCCDSDKRLRSTSRIPRALLCKVHLFSPCLPHKWLRF